jgi:hypothetical protein
LGIRFSIEFRVVDSDGASAYIMYHENSSSGGGGGSNSAVMSQSMQNAVNCRILNCFSVAKLRILSPLTAEKAESPVTRVNFIVRSQAASFPAAARMPPPNASLARVWTSFEQSWQIN